MKKILATLLLCLSVSAVEPLTLDQYNAQKEYESEPDHESFQFNASFVGKFKTGYIKNPWGPSHTPRRLGDGEKLKSWSLRDFGRPLAPILNQGNCGSCVIFSFKANILDLFGVRSMPIDDISAQHYMNCSSGSQCGGAYGEEIADDAVRLGKTGGFYNEKTYPYTASSGRCKEKNGTKSGVVLSWQTIDGSDRSILSALHQGKPVSVGVAANSSFQGYDGGLYSACNSSNINHYIVVTGLNCGKSVDKDGNCKFDEDGNLDKSAGATFELRNSWGKNWGEEGWMKSLVWKNGKRCNGIAAFDGDAQILDNGMPVPPPGPVQFTMDGENVSLNVTVSPEAKVSVEVLKASLQKAVEFIDGSAK